MDDRDLLDELVRVATRLGVQVRIEPFETPPARGGGRCLVEGREFILLDARAPLGDRVSALASALSDLDLDDVYMTPEARDRVEGARDTRVRAREGMPLAPLTTMGVGGPARWYVEAYDEPAVLAALRWAEARGLPLRVLGGGSNLVVADAGVEALVLRVSLRGLAVREAGPAVELTAAAGEPWDDVVRFAVERGWAGLECLSGIPGLVGATPIQNVGAYGQEVSDTVAAVRALDRATRTIVTLAPAACGFGYRDSAFKSRIPDRHVILGVTYRLRPGGAPSVCYAELQRHLAARGITTVTPMEVRESVLAVRRAKSMVLDSADPNRRSCGSFFVNPVVPEAEAERIASVAGDPGMPRWPEPGGERVKLAAAWLVERAGFARGHADGPAGISTGHTLAIVAREGARASDVVRVARRVRDGVLARFGVRLHPEPVFWGFARVEDGLPEGEPVPGGLRVAEGSRIVPSVPALRIGLAYDLFGSYPLRPGDPPDAEVEYEPEATVLVLEAALRRLGHEPLRLGNPHDVLRAAGQDRLPRLDAVLTIAEGYGPRNREGWVPALCEMAGIPALGSDALTLSTTLDKLWAHRVVAAAGVPVPAHTSLESAEAAATLSLPAPFPLFVKPRWEGTAKGIGPSSRVESREALVREVARVVTTYAQPALVEAFLEGPEYTVTLVGHGPPRALPTLQRALEVSTGIGAHALERHPPPPGGWRHVTPGALDPALEAELVKLALRAFEALECRDFARADFRLDRGGRPHFLEMNPLPTFAPDGSFGIIAELLGRPLDDLLAEVLGEALTRLGLTSPA